MPSHLLSLHEGVNFCTAMTWRQRIGWWLGLSSWPYRARCKVFFKSLPLTWVHFPRKILSWSSAEVLVCESQDVFWSGVCGSGARQRAHTLAGTIRPQSSLKIVVRTLHSLKISGHYRLFTSDVRLNLLVQRVKGENTFLSRWSWWRRLRCWWWWWLWPYTWSCRRRRPLAESCPFIRTHLELAWCWAATVETSNLSRGGGIDVAVVRHCSEANNPCQHRKHTWERGW